MAAMRLPIPPYTTTIMNTIPFFEEARRLLQADGYEVHRGQPQDGADLAGACWFTWMRPGMASAEVGPTVTDEREAWASALAHRLANSAIALDLREDAPPPMGPFQAAHLPDEAFDPVALAARLGITVEAARVQTEELRRQAVFMNERYQVNVQRIPAPFGPHTGDMVWLSIKRRDREPIHDWRDLQAIKNALIGEEHEGFEVYPAESRLVDTANQFHLWVFADPKVRLPVGFRTREVMGAPAAAAVGARQRPLAHVGGRAASAAEAAD